MAISEVIEFVGLITAVITIIFTQVNAHRQNKMLLKQSRALMFAEYTRRYQEILLRMPNTIYSGLFSTTDQEAMIYMRLYFDLCSEEYWLWKEGIIPEKTWQIWLEGMQITFNRKPFFIAWNFLGGMYDPDFSKYFRINVVEWNKK